MLAMHLLGAPHQVIEGQVEQFQHFGAGPARFAVVVVLAVTTAAVRVQHRFGHEFDGLGHWGVRR